MAKVLPTTPTKIHLKFSSPAWCDEADVAWLRGMALGPVMILNPKDNV